MRKGLISISLLMIAATACGMTSKKVPEMDHTPAPTSADCCRKVSLGAGQPFEFPSDAKVMRLPLTGVVVAVKGENLGQPMDGLACFQDLITGHHYADAAVCFLDAFRLAFKLDHPSQELVPISVHTDDLDMTRVRLRQIYANLIVWPCEISVHFSAKNQIYWVKGNTIPTPQGLDARPRLSESDAIKAAIRAMGIDFADCSACTAELVVYAGDPENPTLAYRVSAGSGLTDAWDFVVDANTGAILKKLTRVKTGMGS